jgi:acyl-coenzyme A synthetase/AMP-(fatty) acid ligase
MMGVQLRPKLPTVRAFVVMTDRGHMPSGPEPCFCYEELLAAQRPNLPFRWEVTDENTACGLCYTSGTTGRPKVTHTHRLYPPRSHPLSPSDCVGVGGWAVCVCVVGGGLS